MLQFLVAFSHEDCLNGLVVIYKDHEDFIEAMNEVLVVL